MLTKRTNILFSQADWQMLTRLAAKKGTSVGRLVRHAVSSTYRGSTPHQINQAAHQKIRAIRQTQPKLDYKELINYGRKY